MPIAYKVLKKGMMSNSGVLSPWKKGVWKKHEEGLKLCESGFHASKLLPDAINYVTPGVICKVEYRGKVLEQDDKLVAEQMRVVETYRFTKRMAVEFSVFCNRQCLKNYEKEFPNDRRVRDAIEAAERWLKNPTEKNESAAQSAAQSATWSAESARSAESAARSAAESARSAAQSATWSAESARSATWSAESARSAAKRAQHKKLLSILKQRRIQNQFLSPLRSRQTQRILTKKARSRQREGLYAF